MTHPQEDVLLLTGAPGSGKTTVARLLDNGEQMAKETARAIEELLRRGMLAV
jgi:dephospho-CoA kinase